MGSLSLTHSQHPLLFFCLIRLPQVFMRQRMKPCPLAKPGCALSRVGSRVAAQRNLGALDSARGSALGTDWFVQTGSSVKKPRLKSDDSEDVKSRNVAVFPAGSAGQAPEEWSDLSRTNTRQAKAVHGWGRQRNERRSQAMICVARWARGSGRHPR
jgi:hypothetical protein